MKRAVSMFAVAWVAACQPSDGLTAEYRPVVISAVLMAGANTQAVTIRWAPTAVMQSPVGGPSATDVNLWVVSPRGDSVPVVATARAGDFTIALTPLQGMTYRLSGTVLNLPIAAHTTVPSLVITMPRDGDSIRTTLHRSGLFNIEANATGVSGFLLSGPFLEGTGTSSSDHLGDLVTSFDESYIYFDNTPTTATAVIITAIAFDSCAAAFYGVVSGEIGPIGGFRQPTLTGDGTTSTITGALGFFGSSASVPIHLVLAP